MIAQSPVGKRGRGSIGVKHERRRRGEHRGNEAEAFERTRNRALSIIGCRAAWHVRVIRHCHFGGACRNGGCVRCRRYSNGNGD